MSVPATVTPSGWDTPAPYPPLNPGQVLLAKAMTEAQVQEHVRLVCTQLVVLHFHHLRSRGTTPGWPDSVILGPRGILYRELKREGKYPTAAQARVLDLLAATGADVGVWRPTDRISGRITEEIRAISAM